jgi:uncharacterized protein (DUF488 family)
MIAHTKKKKKKAGGRVHGDVSMAKQLPLPPPFAPAGAVSSAPLTIFTIGHSNHAPETFLALLQQHGLVTLVDVRSAPYSRYAPHFNRGDLDALLSRANITYIWAGESLGGRPVDPACYLDGIVRPGNVDYGRMARLPWYQEGIQQLVMRAAKSPTSIMCSEEDPRRCHRHRLIEPSLREQGVTVLHIRKDGSLESIDSAETTIPPAASPQLALFGSEP